MAALVFTVVDWPVTTEAGMLCDVECCCPSTLLVSTVSAAGCLAGTGFPMLGFDPLFVRVGVDDSGTLRVLAPHVARTDWVFPQSGLRRDNGWTCAPAAFFDARGVAWVASSFPKLPPLGAEHPH